jgi:hypothetical protein
MPSSPVRRTNTEKLIDAAHKTSTTTESNTAIRCPMPALLRPLLRLFFATTSS